jgi:hypothetical protein
MRIAVRVITVLLIALIAPTATTALASDHQPLVVPATSTERRMRWRHRIVG